MTHPPLPHPGAIREAARLLQHAQRPLLLVGGGVTRAEANDAVVRLAERHSIPMITAYGRNDAVPNGHPLYIGPLGRAGSPEAAAACKRADVLVAAGSRLGHFTSLFDDRYIKPETKIIQIDIEGRDVGRYYPFAVGIQADARETCVALLEALDEVTSRSGALREVATVAVAGVQTVTTATVRAAAATSTMLQDAGSLASMFRDIGVATGILAVSTASTNGSSSRNRRWSRSVCQAITPSTRPALMSASILT